MKIIRKQTGVSASHLDWTMVPYVRKSFRKHFLDGLKYIDNQNTEGYSDTLSIEDEKYKAHPKAYQYALDMTEKEVNQGVEGLLHNLK